MHARVTMLEIDTLQISARDAVSLFEGEVLPALREEDGYCGVYVLATPEGKGVLVSLWETATQADAGAVSGFYAETLERYVTLFASPPGREAYEVALADLPARTRD